MLDKVVNASILRAISERINDEDCVTEETRLEFFREIRGGQIQFPCVPGQTKRFPSTLIHHALVSLK